MRNLWTVLLCLLPALSLHAQTPQAMSQAAKAFLQSLNDTQKAKATKAFDDGNREDWHFVPMPRQGLALKEMDEVQSKLAHELVKSALSDSGYGKFTANLICEQILAEIEKNPTRRDAGLYYFTIFGQPGGEAPWGWRVEGHHFSQNFTVVDQTLTSTTPSFWGANPAETKGGPHDGLRPLAAEEDLARQLVKSFDEPMKARVVIQETAPRDILTGNKRQIEPFAPAGVLASELSAAQKENLLALIHVYLGNMESDQAEIRGKRIQVEGFDKIAFVWAGGLDKGQGHYYRIQGPSFLIEYDNTQNNANHIHAVWREFKGDFGFDVLAEHYRSTPH
jgi:hypothetical protein